MILIASFPRSGNHLVRFFVEYVTGRATLGCRANPDDLPIVQSFTGPELSHVDVSRPVARKAHFAKEIRAGQKLEKYGALVFVRRSFAKAITSHTRDASGIEKFRLTYDSVKQYLRLWRFYRSWKGPKIALAYELLVSDSAADELARLFSFLGESVIPERADDAIRDFRRLRGVYGHSTRPVGHREFISDVI